LLAVWAIRAEPLYGKIVHNTLAAVFPHVYAKLAASHLLFFASARALSIPAGTPSEESAIFDLLALPNREINTIDNRVLERHFDIRRLFGLPDEYREPARDTGADSGHP
jgi:hypothetical protein